MIELHGFADASERAYAAVVYLCVNGLARSVGLVAAKSKVAPVKQVSLPRLELCAAELLARLVKHVLGSLNLACCTIHLWSDSTVTLAWIRDYPVRWKTYVANRVSEIQRALPDAIWHHVKSEDNPADCASRGIQASDLLAHPLWWTGLHWLLQPSLEWPKAPSVEYTALPEPRVLSHAAAETPDEPGELIRRYSSLTRLQRIAAWCRRFLGNSKIHGDPPKGEHQLASTLLPVELSAVFTCLVKVEQAHLFKAEISTLKSQGAVQKGPLLRLNPVLDGDGTLRVGGRLRHSILDADEKHPVIIPRDSPLTPLLIDWAHRQTLHGGTQLILATLRQRYWIIAGRSSVKSFIGRCIRCLRFRASTATQLMGDLPLERVAPSLRPFHHPGVDYAGPISIRASKGRGHTASKAYIAVFVCFSTRAVHLEAVSDCSTDGFLAAYKRFVSRRGLCRTISSDCGTNFVGADVELRAFFTAASFGGLWEAAVKSVKHHLRRVIGDAKLTFEEISTLLAQTEACLNSRPLLALTDDPDDLSALTSGHFLTGAPLSAVPEPTFSHLALSRLSRWQLVQQMRDSFWDRWSSEYLHQLQARPKWHKPQPPVQVGDLVLIKNEITPPTKWPLGRVTATHPGEDGRVRVVTIRTASSSFKRPIVKLCVLRRREKMEAPST